MGSLSCVPAVRLKPVLVALEVSAEVPAVLANLPIVTQPSSKDCPPKCRCILCKPLCRDSRSRAGLLGIELPVKAVAEIPESACKLPRGLG